MAHSSWRWGYNTSSFSQYRIPWRLQHFLSMGFLLILYDFGNPDQQNALSTICTLCALCKVVIILQSSQLMFNNPINRIGRNKTFFCTCKLCLSLFSNIFFQIQPSREMALLPISGPPDQRHTSGTKEFVIWKIQTYMESQYLSIQCPITLSLCVCVCLSTYNFREK